MADLVPILDFGLQPLANGFLGPGETDRLHPLVVGFDPETCAVRLINPRSPAEMFGDDYAFRTSSSPAMVQHFADWAEDLASDLQPGELLVELGSNDGSGVLATLNGTGINALGVEPSAGAAMAARERGVNTWLGYFSEENAERIASKYGRAKAVVAANCLAHIDDLGEVFRALDILLAPDGFFEFEDPYLPSILETGAFDQFYDEHVHYFSVTSVSALARRHGFDVVSARRQSVHGGSMRYRLRRTEHRARFVAAPPPGAEDNLRDLATYAKFAEASYSKVLGFREVLERMAGNSVRVAGYGATSKSTTALVWGGIGRDLIGYISDTTPTKIGRRSPGAHIPVVSREVWEAEQPDVTVLFAWNHAKEIKAKEADYIARGGRFYSYVPTLGFV